MCVENLKSGATPLGKPELGNAHQEKAKICLFAGRDSSPVNLKHVGLAGVLSRHLR